MQKIAYILMLFLIGGLSTVSAQSINYIKEKSLATYKNSVFKIGQEVQLLYGSNNDQSFAHAEIYNSLNYTSNQKLTADASKQKFTIESVDMMDNQVWIRGKALWTGIEGDNVAVKLKEAIDSKELAEPNNFPVPVKQVMHGKKN